MAQVIIVRQFIYICWDIDPSILILDVLVMINTIAFDDFGVSLSISEKDQCKEQLSYRG